MIVTWNKVTFFGSPRCFALLTWSGNFPPHSGLFSGCCPISGEVKSVRAAAVMWDILSSPPMRTAAPLSPCLCLWSAPQQGLGASAFLGARGCFVVLMLRAPQPEKPPSRVWRPIRALIRPQHPVSLLSRAPLSPAPSPPPDSALSSCRLWQEDGTAHSANRTRTPGGTYRLSAGLLNSLCPVTPGSCSFSCAWSWSGSAGNTEVGKSAGPRRRRRTNRERKYRKSLSCSCFIHPIFF